MFTGAYAQSHAATYCNPLNIDYSYPFRNAHLEKSYRSGADPAEVRYVRLVNVHAPTRNLTISGLRIFGKSSGAAPAAVKNFSVKQHGDQRNATLTCKKQKDAQGYNIRWETAPNKRYSSWLIYDENILNLRCLNTEQKYYSGVEAFSENGLSALNKIVEVK
jgi:hypothetical protein